MFIIVDLMEFKKTRWSCSWNSETAGGGVGVGGSTDTAVIENNGVTPE